MVKLRLKRMGRKNRPFYRIVVADSRTPRDGKSIEEIGYYNPLLDPPDVKLDLDRVDYWTSVGAKPTDTVERIIKFAREDQKNQPVEDSENVNIAEQDILDDQGANTAEGLAFDMVDEAEELENQGE